MKRTYQKRHFDKYAEALRKNIKERKTKKKEEEMKDGNNAGQLDQRTSSKK